MFSWTICLDYQWFNLIYSCIKHHEIEFALKLSRCPSSHDAAGGHNGVIPTVKLHRFMMPGSQPVSSASCVALSAESSPDSAPSEPPDRLPSKLLAVLLPSLAAAPVGSSWALSPPPCMYASPPRSRRPTRPAPAPASKIFSRRTQPSFTLLPTPSSPSLSVQSMKLRSFTPQPAKPSKSHALTHYSDIEPHPWWLEPLPLVCRNLDIVGLIIYGISFCYGDYEFTNFSGLQLSTAVCRIFLSKLLPGCVSTVGLITSKSLVHSPISCKAISVASRSTQFTGMPSLAALCRNLLRHLSVQPLRTLWCLSVILPPLPPVPPDPPDLIILRNLKHYVSDPSWVLVSSLAVSTLFYLEDMSITTALIISAATLSSFPLMAAGSVGSPRSAPWTRVNPQVVVNQTLPLIALGLRVVLSLRYTPSSFLLAVGLVTSPRSAPWTRVHPQVVVNQSPQPQGDSSTFPRTSLQLSIHPVSRLITSASRGFYLTWFEMLGFLSCLLLPLFVAHLPQYEVSLPLYEEVTQPLFEVPLPLYEDVTKPLISVFVNAFVLLIFLSDESGLLSRNIRDELTNTNIGFLVSELVWWVRISSQFLGSSTRCLVISVAILLAASKAPGAAVSSGNEAPCVSHIFEDFIPLSTFDVIISSCFSVMFIPIFYVYVFRFALVAAVDLAFLALACSLLNDYSMDGE